MEFIRNFWNDEEGQGMVEYGLILALIALVVIGILTTMGQTLLAKFTEIANGISGAGGEVVE